MILLPLSLSLFLTDDKGDGRRGWCFFWGMGGLAACSFTLTIAKVIHEWSIWKEEKNNDRVPATSPRSPCTNYMFVCTYDWMQQLVKLERCSMYGTQKIEWALYQPRNHYMYVLFAEAFVACMFVDSLVPERRGGGGEILVMILTFGWVSWVFCRNCWWVKWVVFHELEFTEYLVGNLNILCTMHVRAILEIQIRSV